MKTLEEVALSKENKILAEENAQLIGELSELKERYDSLCSKLKSNANDSRNEGDRFLSRYAHDRKGPWD